MDRKLELDLYDLEAAVGDFAGFGEGARFDDTAWTQDQQRRITKCVDAGLRMVYFTQEMDGIPASYQWSFLQPRSTVTLVSGANSLTLPEDCNGILSTIIPASTDGTAQFPVRVVSYDQVYAARAQSPTQTGRPMMAAQLAVKGTTIDRGNRYALQVWPIADTDYSFQVWYEVNPGPLTPDFPHPYGGAPLAETFKAAVRAAYEQDYDNTRGLETARFVERLRAAIAADRKHKPLEVGYNGDRSDAPTFGRPLLHGATWGTPLEVNGATYA